MQTVQEIENNKKEVEDQVKDYENMKWYKSYRGISSIFLFCFFLCASWSNFFLAIFILPLIHLVSKGKKKAIIISEIYLAFLTLILISNYIESTRTTDGNLDLNLAPILFYIIIYFICFKYLRLAYKIEKKRIADKNL